IRTYLVTPIMVNGPSMQPTLSGGEIMILNKRDKIDRFDVVVVDIKTEDIIKRVIAMPGETISCENGIIYVNDRRQDEEYSKGITSDFDKVTLGEDEYFVLGDNRENSLDSRRFGAFKEEQIKGTAKLVLFPFNKFGNIE
ncbi:MAG: signal peptidase I, partial [Bacilli bacterium]|nr:signal peptidase I [Bacilli bacterium]